MELFPSPIVYQAIPPPSAGLPPLPRPLDLDRPTHWLGDDGKNVFIEVQGKFAAVAIRKGPLSKLPPVRQEVKGFSAASRLRLFKLTNRLDFQNAGRCSFVTATWRDELGCPTVEQVTKARSWFHREVERRAGKNVAGIWRVEWEKRKSGTRKGKFMPHVHIIYFDVPFIPVWYLGKKWARAIGWHDRVSLRIEEIGSLKKCILYVSKYIAKLPANGYLDIASYLNTNARGRAWGVFRKSLLPLSEAVVIRVTPGPLLDRIRELASEAYAKTPQESDTGFCVFGDVADKIRALVDEYCLTQEG